MSEIRVACVIIASERRRAQVWTRVVPSVIDQGFDDIVVVGDWAAASPLPSVRYLCVAPLTRTTTDALVKRDVGTLATDADILVYLCDDHALGFGFVSTLRLMLDEPWDVIVPNRNTWYQTFPSYVSPDGKVVSNDKGELKLIPLNNGERDGYCSGHAGVFRRNVITAKPWSAYVHHRNWDVIASREQLALGARFLWSPCDALTITDLEPQHQPWK